MTAMVWGLFLLNKTFLKKVKSPYQFPILGNLNSAQKQRCPIKSHFFKNAWGITQILSQDSHVLEASLEVRSFSRLLITPHHHRIFQTSWTSHHPSSTHSIPFLSQDRLAPWPRGLSLTFYLLIGLVLLYHPIWILGPQLILLPFSWSFPGSTPPWSY